MSDNTTIQIGRGRKRKPQILALMSLEKGQLYIHDHVDVKTGEPMKTSFAGWLAIQRQRFKKNYQGKKVEGEPQLSPLGAVKQSYEIKVIDFDPNRKPRKPRQPKVKVEPAEAPPAEAPPAEAPPAEAPPAEAPPAEAPPAEAPPAECRYAVSLGDLVDFGGYTSEEMIVNGTPCPARASIASAVNPDAQFRDGRYVLSSPVPECPPPVNVTFPDLRGELTFGWEATA